MTPLPAAITRVCAEYFGKCVGHGRWSPPNRCDSCPLHTPCFAHDAKQPRSIEDLAANRKTFVRAALRVIG